MPIPNQWHKTPFLLCMDSVTWQLQKGTNEDGFLSSILTRVSARRTWRLESIAGGWNNLNNHLIIWRLVHHHVWQLGWENSERPRLLTRVAYMWPWFFTAWWRQHRPSLRVKVNKEKVALFCSFGQSYALSLLHSVGYKGVICTQTDFTSSGWESGMFQKNMCPRDTIGAICHLWERHSITIIKPNTWQFFSFQIHIL